MLRRPNNVALPGLLWCWCWWCLLLVAVLPFGCQSLAINAPSNNKIQGYRVCTASPCKPNGSELLLDALQRLATNGITVKEDYCLGGCCSGTVVKPTGQPNARRIVLPVMADQITAVDAAESLLLDIEALDEDKLQALREKLKAGGLVLENSQEPDICRNCGVGLQLYRGNCAKCGKNPF
jgi:hypothetical protein